jgi:hypothetical protein
MKLPARYQASDFQRCFKRSCSFKVMPRLSVIGMAFGIVSGYTINLPSPEIRSTEESRRPAGSTYQPSPSPLSQSLNEGRAFRNQILQQALQRRNQSPSIHYGTNPYANQGITPPPGMPNLSGSDEERVRCVEVEDIYGNRGVECQRY